jgi:predicted RNA-binding protein with PIN domain
MALHIIIDGYNLIRRSDSFSDLDQRDIQMGREALIDSLAAYKRLKGHRITVVFDGIDAPGFSPQKDRVKGIDIRFSRRGEPADAVIKRMAKTLREKALVVTSDREIADYANIKGAVSVGSAEFEEKLAMASYMDAKGTDEIVEDAGWTPTTKKKGPRRKLSKRARRKKIKTRKL